MNTTSRTSERTTGASRRLKIVAALAVAAGVLAGCSSDGGAYDTSGGSQESYPESAMAYEAEAADGADSAEAADAETEFAPDATGESMIVTGSLNITVDNPLAAADRAAEIVNGAGGRIDARDEAAGDEHDGGSASLTLRIPDTALDSVIGDLRTLGTVDHYATNSRDVTAEVTDLEAKISTLRASTNRIEALLVEAEEIRDIITLEDELAGRQAELESLEARQRGLNDQVAMSTIELSLTTEPIEIEEEDEPRATFMDGLESGWEAFVTFVSGALVVTGALLPWLVFAAVVTAAVVIAVRVRRSRARREVPTSPPPPATASAAPGTAETPPGQ